MSHAEHHPDPIEEVDLEVCFAQNALPPHGKRYRFRVDKQHVTVHTHELTGREILAHVNKTPDKFLLREKGRGGKVEDIQPDQKVDLCLRHIERFMTIPCEVQEGDFAVPRREFEPVPEDEAFLESLGLRWESFQNTIVIYQWSVPPGYDVAAVDVHVRLSAGYPDTQIDMAYFSPALALQTGRNIERLSLVMFDGRQWQQWSRHRTAASTWRVGEDNLVTHMAYVRNWLEAELRR